MTIIISISQFRQNIADYIAKANEGHTVVLKDEKKDQQIAQLVGKKVFNPGTFGKALRDARGVFTARNHPEWRTKKDVTSWLRKSRLSDERTF